MPSRLNPYISFPDGKAREAMEFYRSVLGGDLVLRTFGEFGMEGEAASQIMHGMLETKDGYTIMGADGPPGMTVTVGDNITVSLSGDDTALRGYFEALSAGGSVTTPLEKQMWGDEFGSFTDKFGISWLVNITAS